MCHCRETIDNFQRIHIIIVVIWRIYVESFAAFILYAHEEFIHSIDSLVLIIVYSALQKIFKVNANSELFFSIFYAFIKFILFKIILQLSIKQIINLYKD